MLPVFVTLADVPAAPVDVLPIVSVAAVPEIPDELIAHDPDCADWKVIVVVFPLVASTFSGIITFGGTDVS